jgi:hypothetical protein
LPYYTPLRYVEKRLAEIFVEGDENKDGVLSFGEFMSIVHSVAPHFTDRRALRMYREALSMGNDDDSIGPEAFVNICKTHGLVSLVDLREMKEGSLRALSKTAEQKQQEQKNRDIALAAKAAAMLATPTPLFQTGHKSPADRAAARRSSTLQIMSRKGISQGLLAVAAAQGSAGEGVMKEAAAAAKASPGKTLRRGSMMGSTTPARDLLASLKQAAAAASAGAGAGAGDDPGAAGAAAGGGGPPKAGAGLGAARSTLMGKLRRSSSVGLSSPSSSPLALKLPHSASAKGAADAAPVSEEQAHAESRAEAAALAVGLGHNTGAEVPQTEEGGPRPQRSSLMFGGPAGEGAGAALVEEDEEEMSDSSSGSGSGSGSDSDSGSDDSSAMRGLIARNKQPQTGAKTRVGAAAPAPAPRPAPVPVVAPSHASLSQRSVLASIGNEEAEKRKAAGDSAVAAGGVAALLKLRAEARLLDRLGGSTGTGTGMDAGYGSS